MPDCEPVVYCKPDKHPGFQNDHPDTDPHRCSDARLRLHRRVYSPVPELVAVAVVDLAEHHHLSWGRIAIGDPDRPEVAVVAVADRATLDCAPRGDCKPDSFREIQNDLLRTSPNKCSDVLLHRIRRVYSPAGVDRIEGVVACPLPAEWVDPLSSELLL